VKHSGRSDQLFLEDDEGGRPRVTTDEEQVCEDVEWIGYEGMEVG